MAHASVNFPTKKALREAVEAGRHVSVQSGPFFQERPREPNKTICIEGPWEFHRWYATATIEDGRIVKVK